jgi:hypothetical protein
MFFLLMEESGSGFRSVQITDPDLEGQKTYGSCLSGCETQQKVRGIGMVQELGRQGTNDVWF